jgi:hypothetical protein
MDTQKILNEVLSADKAATDAYDACLAESKQASLLANKKLNDLLEKTKREAQEEVAQMWVNSKAKVAKASDQVKENASNQERLNNANQRVEDVVDYLVKMLLSQKQ